MTVSVVVQKSLLSDMPDAELAAKIASGDDAAFEFLTRRHNPMLYRTACAILRQVLGEDPVPEACVQ
jgi:hypothetical protein